MFTNTKNAVKDYLNEIEKMKKEIQNIFISQLKLDMKELKNKFPNLDAIFVIGSTPEWNDGEECLHSSNVYITNFPESRCDDMYEYVDRMYWDEEQVPDDFLTVNTNLTESEGQEIHQILRTADFEDCLETVFETNFQIVIELADEIKVTVNPYESGY
jgi:hypothetical protein